MTLTFPSGHKQLALQMLTIYAVNQFLQYLHGLQNVPTPRPVLKLV